MSVLSFVTSVTLTSTALDACVGARLALTGAGGAIIAVPMLMFGLQLSAIQAGISFGLVIRVVMERV